MRVQTMIRAGLWLAVLGVGAGIGAVLAASFQRQAAHQTTWSCEDLIRGLKSNSAKDRKASANGLARCAGKIDDAFATLRIKAEQDSDQSVRASCTMLLGYLAWNEVRAKRTKDVLDRLMVTDPDPTVRVSAAWAVGELGSHAAPGSGLLAALRDNEADVRETALASLARIRPSGGEVVVAVRALLEDDVAAVRAAAADALGRLPEVDEQTETALVAASEDSSDDVRRAALISIGRLGVNDDGAVKSLIAALEDDSSMIRAASAWAIGELGPDARSAAPALQRVLESGADECDAPYERHALDRIRGAAEKAELALPPGEGLNLLD